MRRCWIRPNNMEQNLIIYLLDVPQRFWPTIFCVCSVSFSSTFRQLITKISIVVNFWMNQNFFSKIGLRHFATSINLLNSCKKSEKSLEPFFWDIGGTDRLTDKPPSIGPSHLSVGPINLGFQMLDSILSWHKTVSFMDHGIYGGRRPPLKY